MPLEVYNFCILDSSLAHLFMQILAEKFTICLVGRSHLFDIGKWFIEYSRRVPIFKYTQQITYIFVNEMVSIVL